VIAARTNDSKGWTIGKLSVSFEKNQLPNTMGSFDLPALENIEKKLEVKI
jgi:hypothetical protein